MHKLILQSVVDSVRLRASQGDCPTEPAQTIETLENAVLDLSIALAGTGGGVPEGYKLVPIEPTDKMIDAAVEALGTVGRWSICTGYDAMLAATPAPTSPDESRSGEGENS